MTQPLPNMQAALAKVKDGFAYIIPPWNSFFQQFVQPAPEAELITVSPFTANANGTVIFTAIVPITLTLTRGTTVLNIGGSNIVPISIGDTIAWTGPTTVHFLGA